MTSNPRITLAKLPESAGARKELPVLGEHLVFDKSRIIDLHNIPLNGGFLTKTLILSPEPVQRERMRDASVPSYVTSYIVGAPVIGFGLVKVLRSEKEGINPGDLMYGQTPWEAYTVQPYVEGRINFKPEDWTPATFNIDSLELKVVPHPGSAFSLSKYASLLGTPGFSAFVGFEAFAEAAEGKTIYVSAGGSGVGSMVIQLAKAKGMKVIASAGSDSKVEYLKSIGADVAFNYKKEGYGALAKAPPFQVFWDNVGAEALEAAIEHIQPFSHIVCCGSLGDYNHAPSERHGIKNTSLIINKRISVRGFVAPDLYPSLMDKFFHDVPALVAQGKIKSKEIVVEGLEKAPDALLTVFRGYEEPGKVVVVVANE